MNRSCNAAFDLSLIKRSITLSSRDVAIQQHADYIYDCCLSFDECGEPFGSLLRNVPILFRREVALEVLERASIDMYIESTVKVSIMDSDPQSVFFIVQQYMKNKEWPTSTILDYLSKDEINVLIADKVAVINAKKAEQQQLLQAAIDRNIPTKHIPRFIKKSPEKAIAMYTLFKKRPEFESTAFIDAVRVLLPSKFHTCLSNIDIFLDSFPVCFERHSQGSIEQL